MSIVRVNNNEYKILYTVIILNILIPSDWGQTTSSAWELVCLLHLQANFLRRDVHSIALWDLENVAFGDINSWTFQMNENNVKTGAWELDRDMKNTRVSFVNWLKWQIQVSKASV